MPDDAHILNLAATAAAVLLFLFALRSFVVGSNKEPLGWGFGLASGAIAAFLVKDHIGGFGAGLRLGLGMILILPAFRALIHPQRSSILTAVASLLIAFAVAGEPAKRLYLAYGPETTQGRLADTRDELESMQRQKEVVKDRLDKLVLRREELGRELRSLNLSEDALLKHPKTTLLANVLQVKKKYDGALGVIEKEILRLGQRIDALEAGAEMERLGKANPELGGILNDLDEIPQNLDNLGLIERTMRKDELREMLQKELE